MKMFYRSTCKLRDIAKILLLNDVLALGLLQVTKREEVNCDAFIEQLVGSDGV